MRNANFFCYRLLLSAALLPAALFTACEKDDDTSTGLTGELKIEITDAPVDDAAVKGVFVTVAQVKIDGKEVEGFQRQTIDLTAYQNGRTELLGIAELDAKTYSDLTLVLDLAKDAGGNAPGCYVLDEQGQKDDLALAGKTSQEIRVTGPGFEVTSDQVTEVVADFDLRKSVRREAAGGYAFVTEGELAAALRLAAKSQSGVVKGMCDSWNSYADKVIVYAYKKGEFNKNAEVSGQGESKVRFRNAVTSAEVAADGSFELHFLPEGQYELYFAGYQDDDNNGEFEFNGGLSLDILSAIDLGAVAVNANSTVTVNLKVKGILPL